MSLFVQTICNGPDLTLAKNSENIELEILTEMTNDSVTGVVAIPSVIFFPCTSRVKISAIQVKSQYVNLQRIKNTQIKHFTSVPSYAIKLV